MVLNKTLYILICTILLFGIGIATAMNTITLDGDVIITENLDVAGSITGNTIDNLESRIITLESGT